MSDNITAGQHLAELLRLLSEQVTEKLNSDNKVTGEDLKDIVVGTTKELFEDFRTTPDRPLNGSALNILLLTLSAYSEIEKELFSEAPEGVWENRRHTLEHVFNVMLNSSKPS